MFSKIFISAALFGFFLSPIGHYVYAHERGGTNGAALCKIVDDPEKYRGQQISLDVLGKAALHQFDVALVSPKCPERNIFLKANVRFLKNKEFVAFMRKLYPDFPSDDWATAETPKVHVTGKIVRIENRGLLMTYLELEEFGEVGVTISPP